MSKFVGNPLPLELTKRCERASVVLADFLSHAQEQAMLPDTVFTGCKGLVFLSTVKAGYIWSGRFGSGLIVARLEDGSWSAPSAIGCVGVGYGAQAGLQFTDMVIVLRDQNALNSFVQMGNITFGAELALAVGPWGRSAEAGVAATCSFHYSFSKSRGLFGGLSLEGLIIMEHRKTNTKCYGQGVTAKQILSGAVPANNQVALLHQALNTRFPLTKGEMIATPPGASASSYTPIPSKDAAGQQPQQQPLYPVSGEAQNGYQASGYSSMPPPVYAGDGCTSQQATDDKARLIASST